MSLPSFELVPVRLADCRTPQDFNYFWDYGNAHDGPCGELIPAGMQRDDDGFEFGGGLRSQEAFERWYRRNPGHNKDFILNRRPVVAPRYVVGKPRPRPDGTIDFREEMNNALVWRTNPFFVKVGPVIYGNRSDKPPWPLPPWGNWMELGPGGGAMDRGIKDYSYKPPPETGK